MKRKTVGAVLFVVPAAAYNERFVQRRNSNSDYLTLFIWHTTIFAYIFAAPKKKEKTSVAGNVYVLTTSSSTQIFLCESACSAFE